MKDRRGTRCQPCQAAIMTMRSVSLTMIAILRSGVNSAIWQAHLVRMQIYAKTRAPRNASKLVPSALSVISNVRKARTYYSCRGKHHIYACEDRQTENSKDKLANETSFLTPSPSNFVTVANLPPLTPY